jgi:signal transduction histidine kinase
MASGIAHDIKNPLTVILLAAQMISREIERSPSSDAIKEELKRIPSFAGDIERASMSIQKLVDHLRNYSRGIVEEYQVLDIYAVIADALFITANRLNRVAAMARSTVQKGTHFVKGSPNQLEQVFVNLISNASDAMEGCESREVTISVEPCTRDDEPFWRCEVSDTGPGIPDDLKEHIFESFFTTKEKGKGTGLGLSITRGIVKEHSGEIEVVSEVGKGSTFYVYLPRVERLDTADG